MRARARTADTTARCSTRMHMLKKHADMGGKAEAPRMGDSMAVADQQLRAVIEPLEGHQHRRSFPKGEQPGHIGKTDLRTCRNGFDLLP